MSSLRRTVLIAASLFFTTIASTLQAEETKLVVGGTVPAIEAKDQHEKEFKLGDESEWLMVAFDMGTGKAANGRLEKKGATWLDEHKAIFVSNIHGMPGVGRMFALPKMRKYPHRIILADAAGLLDSFPTSEGKVTVLKLKPGRVIEAISYWDPRKDESPF